MATPNPKVARKDKLMYITQGEEPEIFDENTENFHNLREYIENILNVGRSFLSMKESIGRFQHIKIKNISVSEITN